MGRRPSGRFHNAKYINGLIETLESVLDKWIVSGAMATEASVQHPETNRTPSAGRRIGRHAFDAPPLPPPEEHIPAVEQQLQSSSSRTNTTTKDIVKPMGAMIKHQDQEENASERLSWEQKHRMNRNS
ncbi:hypothetical protein ACHAW5_004270 [Stephanodiscus triporus]|uniref:Uncharacterized protein n=1 Tax=Stephanodiscus triporus TaxID=2934178 RepID=A0ABD3MIB9_9STRA